jgi:uncharacterized protein YkwD
MATFRILRTAAALAAATLAVAAPATTAAPARKASASALEQDVLARVNDVRRSHGLRPVRLSAALGAAAAQHSAEMARRGYFSHDSAGGGPFDRRIARFYPMASHRYWSVGENLLWSSPDVDGARAIGMWMTSPEHRKILLTARWREIGLSAVHVAAAPGAYRGLEVTILTADFGVRR